MKITNIIWDTDGEIVENLPKEVELPENINIDDVADWLSDNYGWCVESFSCKPSNKPANPPKPKKKFEIRYEETLVGFFEVEADTEENAIEEFWALVGEGKIDLLDTEMMDSKAEVTDCEEE